VELWQKTSITDDDARLAMFWAFVGDGIQAPTRLIKRVNQLYFEDDRFPAGTFWRLSNAFTSALKELDPIPQFQATARVGRFLSSYFDDLSTEPW
jgi:hypothetical protein